MRFNFLLGFLLLLIYPISSASQSIKSEACEALRDFPNSIKNIQNNAKRIISGQDDSCVLSLLDSLTDRFIKESNEKYLICLDSISQISDGYVSEALTVVNTKLLYENFRPYIKYLYKKKNVYESLIDFLLFGLNMEIATAKDRNEEERRIKKYFAIQQDKYKLTSSESAFINKIVSQIDPKKVD